MATWKSVQEAIKNSMRELGDLYEEQHNDRKEQHAQFQKKYSELQQEYKKLKKAYQDIKAKYQQQKQYIETLEANTHNETPSFDVDSVEEVSFDYSMSEDAAFDSVSEEVDTQEQQRLAEEARMAEEAQQERQREIERAREQQKQEELQRQRLEEEEQERLMQELQAQEERQAEERERQRAAKISELEAEYQQVCAQLSLLGSTADGKQSSLAASIEQAKEDAKKSLNELRAQYQNDKNNLDQMLQKEIREVEERFASQIQSLQSQGNPSAQEAAKEQELNALDQKIAALDGNISKTSGFFGGKKKVQFQQERDELARQRDEIESQLMYIRQKGGGVVDPQQISALEAEKKAEVAKRQDAYSIKQSELENNWSNQLNAAEKKSHDEIAALDERLAAENANGQESDEKRSALEQRKSEIENELGALS
ncbi:MAG: hypothetical protein VX278_10015 [Myxococcota bacterium]|nr:hypothetical protein [Myxococcota bacterium]